MGSGRGARGRASPILGLSPRLYSDRELAISPVFPALVSRPTPEVEVEGPTG